MEQPTIKDVADQLEQLFIRILLSILSQQKDEITRLNKTNQTDF